MTTKLFKDALGWGVGIWLIGYALGIAFFFVMPIGVAVTLWVLLKKVQGDSLRYYLILAIAWTFIAVAFDYLFIVKMLKPADSYYKLDVYLYYTLTFIMPLVIGWYKNDSRIDKSNTAIDLSQQR